MYRPSQTPRLAVSSERITRERGDARRTRRAVLARERSDLTRRATAARLAAPYTFGAKKPQHATVKAGARSPPN